MLVPLPQGFGPVRVLFPGPSPDHRECDNAAIGDSLQKRVREGSV